MSVLFLCALRIALNTKARSTCWGSQKRGLLPRKSFGAVGVDIGTLDGIIRKVLYCCFIQMLFSEVQLELFVIGPFLDLFPCLLAKSNFQLLRWLLVLGEGSWSYALTACIGLLATSCD